MAHSHHLIAHDVLQWEMVRRGTGSVREETISTMVQRVSDELGDAFWFINSRERKDVVTTW